MKFWKILAFVFSIVLLYAGAAELYRIFGWMFGHLDKYRWMFVGMGLFIVLMFLPLYRKNGAWFETTSHELTHAAIGILFGSRIHQLLSTSNAGGEVQYSGIAAGIIPTALAPYTFPLFTLPFLLLSLLSTKSGVPWFNACIGFTLAFHLRCFMAQTRPYQPDIQKTGYLLSFLYIPAVLMMNLSIVLMTVRFGFADGCSRLFSDYWTTLSSLASVF